MVKRMIVLGVMVLGILGNQTTWAETHVSGDVSGTWTVEGSPYVVQNSILVEQDASLRILPGVIK